MKPIYSRDRYDRSDYRQYSSDKDRIEEKAKSYNSSFDTTRGYNTVANYNMNNRNFKDRNESYNTSYDTLNANNFNVNSRRYYRRRPENDADLATTQDSVSNYNSNKNDTKVQYKYTNDRYENSYYRSKSFKSQSSLANDIEKHDNKSEKNQYDSKNNMVYESRYRDYRTQQNFYKNNGNQEKGNNSYNNMNRNSDKMYISNIRENDYRNRFQRNDYRNHSFDNGNNGRSYEYLSRQNGNYRLDSKENYLPRTRFIYNDSSESDNHAVYSGSQNLYRERDFSRKYNNYSDKQDGFNNRYSMNAKRNTYVRPNDWQYRKNKYTGYSRNSGKLNNTHMYTPYTIDYNNTSEKKSESETNAIETTDHDTSGELDRNSKKKNKPPPVHVYTFNNGDFCEKTEGESDNESEATLGEEQNSIQDSIRSSNINSEDKDGTENVIDCELIDIWPQPEDDIGKKIEIGIPESSIQSAQKLDATVIKQNATIVNLNVNETSEKEHERLPIPVASNSTQKINAEDLENNQVLATMVPEHSENENREINIPTTDADCSKGFQIQNEIMEVENVRSVVLTHYWCTACKSRVFCEEDFGRQDTDVENVSCNTQQNTTAKKSEQMVDIENQEHLVLITQQGDSENQVAGATENKIIAGSTPARNLNLINENNKMLPVATNLSFNENFYPKLDENLQNKLTRATEDTNVVETIPTQSLNLINENEAKVLPVATELLLCNEKCYPDLNNLPNNLPVDIGNKITFESISAQNPNLVGKNKLKKHACTPEVDIDIQCQPVKIDANYVITNISETESEILSDGPGMFKDLKGKFKLNENGFPSDKRVPIENVDLMGTQKLSFSSKGENTPVLVSFKSDENLKNFVNGAPISGPSSSEKNDIDHDVSGVENSFELPVQDLENEGKVLNKPQVVNPKEDKIIDSEEIQDIAYINATEKTPAQEFFERNRHPLTPTDFRTGKERPIKSAPKPIRTESERYSEESLKLVFERQGDMLSRGTMDVVFSLLEQFNYEIKPYSKEENPRVLIISDLSENYKVKSLGTVMARSLLSHGLRSALFSNCANDDDDVVFYEAFGGTIINNLKDLFEPDILIIVTDKTKLGDEITEWIKCLTIPILAIDPPSKGIENVKVYGSVFPSVPIDAVTHRSCSDSYVSRIGHPKKFFDDLGYIFMVPLGPQYIFSSLAATEKVNSLVNTII